MPLLSLNSKQELLFFLGSDEWELLQEQDRCHAGDDCEQHASGTPGDQKSGDAGQEVGVAGGEENLASGGEDAGNN